MSKNIYTTQEKKHGNRQNYYHNEYRDEGDNIGIYKCNRHKEFDGRENNWVTSERKIDTISKDSDSLPDWLKSKL